MGPDAGLVELVARRSRRPVGPAARALADAVRARHGGAVRAVLVYGSCYRTGDPAGVFDLYVLVERYRAVYRGRALAVANRLLPPNVFWLEVPVAETVVRAKYAVLSLADFARGTSPRAFHSYFWGRFAQPVGLVYASDPAVEARVVEGLARAVVTFLGRTVPLVADAFDAAALWQRGLALSYGAELRAEGPGRPAQLYAADADHYEAVTPAALTAGPWPVTVIPAGGPTRYQAAVPGPRRVAARLAWAGRRGLGRVLSVLRLAKGAFTVAGGLDYVAWKIERHTGVAVAVSARARRWPLLAGWVLAWRFYRRRAVRSALSRPPGGPAGVPPRRRRRPPPRSARGCGRR